MCQVEATIGHISYAYKPAEYCASPCECDADVPRQEGLSEGERHEGLWAASARTTVGHQEAMPRPNGRSTNDTWGVRNGRAWPGSNRSRAGQLPMEEPVTQETLNKMVTLRRQNVSHGEIAKRTGYSERTVRRYTRHVVPQLTVPQAGDQPPTELRALRRDLLHQFMDELFQDQTLRSLTLRWIPDTPRGDPQPVYGGPPSTRLLGEAERLLHDALVALGGELIRFLTVDEPTRKRFVHDVIGELLADYERWLYVKQQLADEECRTGEDWKPRRERSAAETKEVDDIWRRRRELGGY